MGAQLSSPVTEVSGEPGSAAARQPSAPRHSSTRRRAAKTDAPSQRPAHDKHVAPSARFPVHNRVVTGTVAQFLGVPTLVAFSASCRALHRTVNHPDCALWQDALATHWNVHTQYAAVQLREGEHAHVTRDWRLRFVQEHAIGLASEETHVKQTQAIAADIHAYGTSNGWDDIIGILADFVWFDTPAIAYTVSNWANWGLHTLLVRDATAIQNFRAFQRRRGHTNQMGFMPLDTLDSALELPMLPEVDPATTPGFVGFVHDLARLRPEHARFRPILRFIFRDRALFDTEDHAQAWKASSPAPRDSAGREMRTITISSVGSVNAAATSMPHRSGMQFSCGIGRKLCSPKHSPVQQRRYMHDLREKCQASLMAICRRDCFEFERSPVGRDAAGASAASPTPSTAESELEIEGATATASITTDVSGAASGAGYDTDADTVASEATSEPAGAPIAVTLAVSAGVGAGARGVRRAEVIHSSLVW